MPKCCILDCPWRPVGTQWYTKSIVEGLRSPPKMTLGSHFSDHIEFSLNLCVPGFHFWELQGRFWQPQSTVFRFSFSSIPCNCNFNGFSNYSISSLLIWMKIWMVGVQRPPSLDYAWLVLGGRPKAAIADERKTVAHSFTRPVTSSSDALPCLIRSLLQMSHPHVPCHKHKLVFWFRLARLWRALISSIYIYIY